MLKKLQYPIMHINSLCTKAERFSEQELYWRGVRRRLRAYIFTTLSARDIRQEACPPLWVM